MQMPHVTRTLRTCSDCLLAAKAHASASRKSQMVPDEGFTSIADPVSCLPPMQHLPHATLSLMSDIPALVPTLVSVGLAV